MCSLGEVDEVLELVEAGACSAAGAFSALSGLPRALLDHKDPRALDLLAKAPEPFARALLDLLRDDLRHDARAPKALVTLPALLARRPLWLAQAAAHPLARELAQRAARRPEPAALLSLAVLLAAAPPAQAAADQAPRALLAALAAPPDPRRAHAARAAFRALYAARPAPTLDALRRELRASEPSTRARLEQELPSLLASVPLHPRLVLPSAALDDDASLDGAPPFAPPGSPVPPLPALPRPPPQRELRPGREPWFALAEACGADSAPHTPLPPEAGAGGSPPEAAVEATPENTPAKEARDARPHFSFGGEGGAVRALTQLSSQPPSPLRRDAGEGRLARMLRERDAASPQPDDEDREVLELTGGGGADWPPEWPPLGGGPRRPASCPARAAPALRPALAVDRLLADLHKALPDTADYAQTETTVPASAALDEYLRRLYEGGSSSRATPTEDPSEQLRSMHALLMYERWRRDTHAERNRRLLGRVRRARAAELANAALRERLAAAERELEALRTRLRRPLVEPCPLEQLAKLDRERALEAEARARADADRARVERQLASRDGELQKLRRQATEAQRHKEHAAKAQADADAKDAMLAALRRELLELGERSARQAAANAAQRARPPPSVERSWRALRAEAAAARHDAEANAARAEAAAARAAELEALLAARDASAAELRRAALAAAEEHAARQDALQDKYRALMHVLRRVEARRLELLAGDAAPSTTAAASTSGASSGSPSSTVAASTPALDECSRVRQLLDDELDDDERP